MSADDTREGIECQHGAFAGSAACDHKVSSAGVQKNSCQNAVLHIGELGFVIGRVHAVVDHQSGADPIYSRKVQEGLAALIYWFCM